MDYSLENLGPERFQEICHALLAKAFPKTQCFPVGQRDAGRDALSFYLEHDSDGFIVHQVKFVRKPLAVADPHKWLKETIEKEAPKLQKLIPKGAKEYYFLTNVPGTAYPESGSIDAVQTILDENLDVPAQCWWRDDINRRLDDAWDIKWSYPDILSGPDILRLIVERGLTEDAERRTLAIQTFLRDQFQREKEVRFKQVELQNDLLDLFIDVPISLRESSTSRKSQHRELAAFHVINAAHGESDHQNRQSFLGAATLFLHPTAQQFLNRAVIEGAPGQGKSTITQYICQIHRRRILNDGVNDQRIPNQHRDNPVRIPFKTDCRDLALWLNRKNPFSSDETTEVPSDWHKSIESFLAAQVNEFSGGSSFSVADLQAVFKLSAVLLVFDGLDEVADIRLRQEVVEEISKGVNRLGEIAVSLQSIVTSRPAAFANSPGLAEPKFRYFQLDAINRPLIERYSDKWLKARRLQAKEAADFKRILKSKLDQPHLQELSRNPMQLAILLSLIQTRGGSLPDKRTALYDSYIELFLNREAEKSTVVLDHRELLINLHGYLAWILHSEAQTKQNRGSVSAERLRQLVVGYLTAEGHPSELAHRLMAGVVERFFALVSRVEGTYEFEVQPLREYFAARHLYNTAPYSPPGKEQRGTKPERFSALARDFFWQNVTRFYAGCYSIGELPSLVDGLQELVHSAGYKHTSHPQSLAATLLSDWVFAQHPKSMKHVVTLVLDGIGLRQVTSGGRRYRRDEPFVLPSQSGNSELVDRCFELLRSDPPEDYAIMLLDLIRANASREEAAVRWENERKPLKGSDLTRWTKYGLFLGVLSNLPPSSVETLIDGDDIPKRLAVILQSGQFKCIESQEDRFVAVVDDLLGRSNEAAIRRGDSILKAFSDILAPHRYACAIQNRHPAPLSEIWHRSFGYSDHEIRIPNNIPSFETAGKCRRVVELGVKLCGRAATEWATEIGPWDALVEGARNEFGDRWAFYILANAAAGIRSKSETCDDATELHSQNASLCRRTRYARLRANASNWWESQIQSTSDQSKSAFALLVALTWAGQTVLQKIATLIDARLLALDVESWHKLSEAIQFTAYGFSQDKRDIEIDLQALPDAISERYVVALSTRISVEASEALFKKHLSGYDGEDPVVLEFCQRSALLTAQRHPESWQDQLPIIARSYSKQATADRYFGYRFSVAGRSQMLPLETAVEIIEHCSAYPTELVGMAEQACRKQVMDHVVPVGIVAAEQEWFSSQ